MTLLKDNNYKEINVALLSLEADIKNKITNLDTSAIDKQLAEINNRIDKINAGGGNNSSDEIEDINYKLNSNSTKIKNIERNIEDIDTQINDIEQKLLDIFSAENCVTDFNATTDSGIYYWTPDAANRPIDYGVLLVNNFYGGNDSIWINQIAYGTNNKIYFRQNINTTGWTEWKAVAFEGSMKAKFLDEYVGAGGTRLTSGNIVPKDASEYGGMRKDVVTSSMTDSGYPGQDGHLLTMFWDNGGRYDSQFFISNEKQPPTVKVRVKDNKADYGPWVDLITSQNIGSQTVANASTAGTADYADRLKTFASWNKPYVYDPTNGVRVNVYKITMPSDFNSILVQIYDDINYVRCRRYILGLWHHQDFGYNVSVTDLGGTKANGLKVWMGTDGNVYLQADVIWVSRISFSYLDDITDVTITKIGEVRYGSNTDINGNVLFTPLADPIVDCGAIRADDSLSAASKEPEFLKAYWLYASNKMVIPIGAPSSLEDGCIWIER